MARPTPLSGYPELLPAARTVEREAIASLSRTFELHGFANIETRVVEPLDRLAKGGEISAADKASLASMKVRIEESLREMNDNIQYGFEANQRMSSTLKPASIDIHTSTLLRGAK